MCSFESTVLIYGCPERISSINIRLPVAILFAFNIEHLLKIVNDNTDLCQSSLPRYFIVLFQSIDQHLLQSFQTNHRIISIYHAEVLFNSNQIRNSTEQLTLDITNDIIHFFINEGKKQMKLERLSLVKIYYQQARILQQWAMSLFKAQPSHILLISLNSSQQNMDSAQLKLQELCTKLGYTSTIIRQLNDYIPNSERHSSLLPFCKVLFENEDPNKISILLKSLSSIRLYLYGNNLSELNNWSELLINNEEEMMNDEDNWSAFIENEFLQDNIKWNFAFLFGKKWKISRVSPFQIDRLTNDLRFQSALRRSHLTYSQRQIEITSNIFDWYNKSLENGFIHLQPKLTAAEEQSIKQDQIKHEFEISRKYFFRNLSTFDYKKYRSNQMKSISFIWFDQILNDCDEHFNEIISPYHWMFFNKCSDCMSFIENEIRKKNLIIFIVSGSIGNDLFTSGSTLLDQIYSTYVYCAQIQTHSHWTKKYSQIKGIFNDSNKLTQQIQKDFHELNECFKLKNSTNEIHSMTDHRNEINDEECYFPIIVYDSSNPDGFLSHQRTIDSLLCMPHTDESKTDMIQAFQKIYHDNQTILMEIDQLEENYHSNMAIQFYTRDSFICRTIHKILRLSDANLMFQFRHILIDIYLHLKQSYAQSHSPYFYPSRDTFYRGQMMSNEEFNHLKENQGNIISIKTFLSTTTSMQIALMYAGQYFDNSDLVSVIFTIEKDSVRQTRPYANISHYSLFRDEEEVLFAMGSFFTIGNIRQMPDADHIYIVHLKMTDQFDFRFQCSQN